MTNANLFDAIRGPVMLIALGILLAADQLDRMQKIKLPDNTSIDASVGIGQIPQGFGIQVWLKVHIPDMPAPTSRACCWSGSASSA